jgi:hypothetical protein
MGFQRGRFAFYTSVKACAVVPRTRFISALLDCHNRNLMWSTDKFLRFVIRKVVVQWQISEQSD